MRFRGIFADVADEAFRSIDEHGEQKHLPLGTGKQVALLHGDSTPVTMGEFASVRRDATDIALIADVVSWADILLEEVAEALAEDDPALVRAELVQVAAVVVKFIEAIDTQSSAVGV